MTNRKFLFLCIAGIFLIIIFLTHSNSMCDDLSRDFLSSTKTASPSNPNPKIEASLSNLVDSMRGKLTMELDWVPGSNQSELQEKKIRLVIETRGEKVVENVADHITRLGGKVELIHKNRLQVLISIEVIEKLATLPEVKFIRLPMVPSLDTISEGVQVIGAQNWHQVGFKGEGVKIAILDESFDGYTNLMGTDLPSQERLVTKSFRSDGKMTGNGDHGTACAEIVHDIAPEAKLYLLAYNTLEEYLEALDWLKGQDIDIVSESVTWFTGAYQQGNGVLDDEMDKLREVGVLWVTTAGNYAKGHWDGDWKDDDSDDWLNFGPEDMGQSIKLKKGDKVRVFLSWDDPWGRSENDYDLYLFETGPESEEDYVFRDNDIQDGDDYPTESIVKEVPKSGTYFIAIKHKSGSQNVHLDLFIQNNVFEYSKAAHSIGEPGISPHVLTVGATDLETDELKSYSSQGPTYAGLTKPDLTAPTDVSTRTFDGSFGGTSVATPHIAGAAALIRQAYPSKTPKQIQDFMEEKAKELGPYGKDNQYGAGRIVLGGPPVSPPEADFTASPRQGFSPLKVHFKNKSAGKIDSYYWTFGDGNTSTSKTPTHTYHEGGKYTVELTVEGPGGKDTERKYNYIIVKENHPPKAEAGPDQEVKVGKQVNLDGSRSSDPDGDQLSYRWKFVSRPEGSQATLSTPTSVQSSFMTDVNGEYVIKLKVEDERGLSDTDQVKITAIPIYEFEANLRQGAFGRMKIPQRIREKLPSFTEYQQRPKAVIDGWISDDLTEVGLRLSESTGAIMGKPTKAGKFKFLIDALSKGQVIARIWALVTVTPPIYEVEGELGKGKFGRLRIPEGIQDKLPIFAKYIERPNTELNGITSNSLAKVGLLINGSTGTIMGTPSKAGKFQFLIEVLSGEKVAARIWVNLTVKILNKPPHADFSFTPKRLTTQDKVKFNDLSEDPDGQIVSWSWDFGDGGTSMKQNPIHQYIDNGTYIVKLVVTDAKGAESRVQKEVIVYNVSPTAMVKASPLQGSVPLEVSFNGIKSKDPDGTIVRYKWSFGDGSPPKVGRKLTHTYQRPGVFTATLTIIDDDGASSKDSVMIKVNIAEYELTAKLEEGVYGEIVLPDKIKNKLPPVELKFKEKRNAKQEGALDNFKEVGFYLDKDTGTIFGTPADSGDFRLLVNVFSNSELIAKIWVKVNVKKTRASLLSKMVVRNDGNGDGDIDSKITSIKEKNGSKSILRTVTKYDCDGSGDLDSSIKITTESDTRISVETLELPRKPKFIEVRKTQTMSTTMLIEQSNVCEGYSTTKVFQVKTVFTTYTTKAKETGEEVSKRITITIDEGSDGIPETFLGQQGGGINVSPVEINAAVEKRGTDISGPNNFVRVTTTATQTSVTKENTANFELAAIIAITTDLDGRTSTTTRTKVRTRIG